MTFKEYVTQETPKRTFSGVEVTKSDVVAIWSVGNGMREVGLYVGETYFVYGIPKDSQNMHTLDPDGNHVNSSCFKYID